MFINQRIWIVLVGGWIFSLSGTRCQGLTNNSKLLDMEKELIESFKEYEEINRISTPALVTPKSLPVSGLDKHSYRPWKEFNPYAWSHVPMYKVPLKSSKTFTSPQIPASPNSKHSTIAQQSFPHLTTPINGKREFGSSSPYIYISNKYKTMYLSTDDDGAARIHDVGNTETSADFNVIVINDCHNCPDSKLPNKGRLITQPRGVPSDYNPYLDPEFQALLQLVKEEDDKNSNGIVKGNANSIAGTFKGLSLSDRQAILNRPYDTPLSNNVVDGAELVVNPSMDKNRNSALDNSIDNIVPEGPNEGFKSSNVSLSDENQSGINSRKKRSAVELQIRQVPGDLNSAMTGLSQPNSVGSGSLPSSFGSMTQPNSIANIGTRPGDNLSSGGGEASGPTIPGSVGVPASREAVAPRNPASPFQSNDSPWWRSVKDLPAGSYTMAVIVTDK